MVAASIGRGKGRRLCLWRGVSPGESPVYRKRSTSTDDERDGNEDHQEKELDAFALLLARPVHEEAVLNMRLMVSSSGAGG